MVDTMSTPYVFLLTFLNIFNSFPNKVRLCFINDFIHYITKLFFSSRRLISLVTIIISYPFNVIFIPLFFDVFVFFI